MPKKKTSTRKNLVKRLDTVVSLYIRERDKKCVQCGSVENLTNGHVFTRRYHSTRWDISKDGNCHTQCWSCNYKHGWQPLEYYNWYIGEFGQEKFDELYQRHKQITKLTNNDLKELLEEINGKRKND